MPVVVQLICDRCGAVKKEANSWWTVHLWPGQFVVQPYSDTQVVSRDADVRYLCGVDCVIKCLSEFMGHEHVRMQGQETT